ncbi:amine sulfotransferase-like [Acipenser oxyrinchus oxyrinchus]|uniref:Sulfotransferase n=1 Tax=Acipenser oxyrinchus oxyrinchus TaxID=40147 RepID=A0AAD8LLI8_ACIOX|nr:amine sulfotransferase-like [Acipenser oxyrinchus oxyrinchus]
MADAPDFYLYQHKGFYLISGIHSAEELDKLKDCEIRDTDIFTITYPKSGTIWMQQILSLIDAKGDLSVTDKQMTSEQVPWLELTESTKNFASMPSPRVRVSHLPYYLAPLGLRQKKGKVIYVARNPKDVLVSYYHFHKVAVMLETPKDFNEFFDKFMEGRVCGSCWFDHIAGWYTHKDEMNFLYLTYEEMIQDLKAAVLKICSFLGKQLDEQQIDSVVKHCTFKQMKTNPNANYESVSQSLLNHKEGAFMRKGTVGDWKNHLTVAQNEMFDQVFQERMRDLPLKFVWDISELKTCS